MSQKASLGSLPPIEESQASSPKNSPKNPLELQFSPTSKNRFLLSPIKQSSRKQSRRSKISLDFDTDRSMKKSGRFLILPDFYIGSNYRRGTPESRITNVFEKYEKTIKFMNEMDSRSLQLSKETYFSSFEQNILNSLNYVGNEKKKNQITGRKLLHKSQKIWFLLRI